MSTVSSLVSASATPLTVKVATVFQLDGVKVCDAGDTLATPVSPLIGVMVTSAVGWLSSATV